MLELTQTPKSLRDVMRSFAHWSLGGDSTCEEGITGLCAKDVDGIGSRVESDLCKKGNQSDEKG